MAGAAKSEPPRAQAAARALARWVWGAPLVVGVVSALLAPALFFGKVFFLRDAQSWFYPSRLYLRQHVIEGRLPEWLPELNLGMPFLADPGNGVIYPPNLLLLLPAPGCVGQFLALHVLLAALGTYHLLEVLEVDKGGRVVGALTFGLSGYVLSMTSSGVYLLAIAWMPLVAARGLDAYRRATTRHTATFAAALGCQLLAGEPQGVQFTALLLTALLVAEPGRPLRHWGHAAGGALLGVGLAMPTLLPAAGFLMDSKRQAGMNLAETSLFSLHPLRLAELLVPGIFGNADDNPHYLGYFLVEGGSEVTPWVATLYAGSLSIVFATLAFLTRKARPPRWAWTVLALMLATLFIALGRHTPVFSYYQALIPGAGYFRYPAKFFALVTLCLALLSALGVDQLARNESAAIRPLAWLLGGLAAGLGSLLLLRHQLLAALQARRPAVDLAAASTNLQAALLPELGIVVLALLCVVLARRRTPAPRWLYGALAGALALQLAFANQHVLQTTRGALYARPSPLIVRMRTLGPPDAARRLFVPDKVGPLVAPCMRDFDQETLADWKRIVLKMNTGIVHGVHYARSYTSFASSQSERVWHALARAPDQALDMFSVGYVLAANPAARGPSPEARSSCFSLSRNPDSFPYARVVARARRLPSFDAVLEQIAKPEVLRGEVVLLETEAPTTEDVVPPRSSVCRFERKQAEHLELSCDSDHGGWAVVNESYNSNWKASVDGAPTTPVRANGLVMAVAIGPGPHTVALTYAEPRFRYALAIAAVTTLVLLGMLLLRGARGSTRAGESRSARARRGPDPRSSASTARSGSSGREP